MALKNCVLLLMSSRTVSFWSFLCPLIFTGRKPSCSRYVISAPYAPIRQTDLSSVFFSSAMLDSHNCHLTFQALLSEIWRLFLHFQHQSLASFSGICSAFSFYRHTPFSSSTRTSKPNAVSELIKCLESSEKARRLTVTVPSESAAIKSARFVMLLRPRHCHAPVDRFFYFLTGYCSILGTSSQIFLQLFIFYHILIVAQSEIFYNHFIFGDKGVHTYGRINIWKYI